MTKGIRRAQIATRVSELTPAYRKAAAEFEAAQAVFSRGEASTLVRYDNAP